MATRTKRAPKKASKATAATKKVQPIPAGYPSITPYLRVRETDRALAFYTKAFGAKAKGRMAGVDGRVMHAEMQVFNTRVMLSDEFPERGTLSPESLKGSPVGLFVYTRDVFARARTHRKRPASPSRSTPSDDHASPSYPSRGSSNVTEWTWESFGNMGIGLGASIVSLDGGA